MIKTVKVYWKKYVTPCINATCAAHDKWAVRFWLGFLMLGTACVVGWVYMRAM